MKIGLIGRADHTGLGIQTFDFYKHINPVKTLVINLQHLNGLQTDIAKYPGAHLINHTPYPAVVEGNGTHRAIYDEFLDGLDLLFSCETFYDYYLVTEARRRGVKTILQYNFELLDHLLNPNAPQPDLFLAPSLWRYDDVKFDNKVFVPVPVDTKRFVFQQRNEVQTFLHVAGNPAAEDRNGTLSVMRSWKHVTSDAKLLVRSPRHIFQQVRNVEVDFSPVGDNLDLYTTGDVLLLPRKYGGLSLPLNEALAVGMPVIMTDVSPQNGFLPPEALIPVRLDKQIMTKTYIDVNEVDQEALAAKVDELKGNPLLVKSLSEASGELAQRISWEMITPVYHEVFEAVMDGQTPTTNFKW